MRRISPGALLWSIILGAAVIGIAYLLGSGKLAFFLHPRTWGALRLATVLLLLLCVVSWRDSYNTHTHRPVSLAHVLFLLPLLLALSCPPQMLSLEIISKKGLLGVLRGHAANCTETHAPLVVFAPDQAIIVKDENFLVIMEALWEHTDSYLGYELEMLGFVYEDPLLGSDDFVLARLVMTCCAADAEVAGLLCRYSERGGLTAGQWVTVRGRIGKMPYYNAAVREVIDMPYLQVTETIPSEKPAQEYIYP